jgi:hypothetical protein
MNFVTEKVKDEEIVGHYKQAVNHLSPLAYEITKEG